MVKSSFYMVNFLLFIWSSLVFIWSTFYFLYQSVLRQTADFRLQTADCRLGVKCRPRVKCRLKTARVKRQTWFKNNPLPRKNFKSDLELRLREL